MPDTEFESLPSDVSRLLALAILYERPLHGYGILEELDRRLGRKVSPGLLYPFLRLLEKRRLLTHKGVRIGRKSKKVYKLTPQGKRLSLSIFKRMTSIMAQAIEPTLDTCANCGCKVYEGGHTQTIDGTEMSFCCSYCAQAYLSDLKNREEHQGSRR